MGKEMIFKKLLHTNKFLCPNLFYTASPPFRED